MKRLLTILTVIIILIAPISTYANEREYFIDGLNIEAQILNNGDVEVNEILEYRFDGDFNGIYRNLELVGTEEYIINSISIIDEKGEVIKATQSDSEENNTYEINDEFGETEVKIFSESSDESKKFKINYTIKGAAKKYADYAELYWDFYNVENIEAVKSGTLTIKLKDEKFDLDNFSYDTYGDGEIIADHTENAINIKFADLTTLIGIDLCFQKDFLSDAEELDFNIEDENYLDYIPEYYEESDKTAAKGIILFSLLIGGAAVITFVMKKEAANKKVEEYRKTAIFTNEEYVMEPPADLPPALVNLLINEKIVAEEMLNVSLMYLANKGYYKIEEVQYKLNKDIVFIRTNLQGEFADSHLEFLLNWFKEYEEDGEFTMTSVKKIVSSKRKAQNFINNLNYWLKKVKDDAEKRGFYIKIGNKKVLENSWYNEQLRWKGYKKYLTNIYQNEDLNNNFESDLTLIYAAALELKEAQLRGMINSIKTKANYYNDYFNNQNYIFMNNYFVYTTMFHNINNDANNIINPPMAATDFNNSFNSFSGSDFSGSDFSGDGGGGSGAF